MSFSWLSTGVWLAGLGALATGLFLLQRLRVRHREVVVVTNLFWREAVEETRARVFVQRFRHPWAYLLILAIASLVWLAVAGPESSSSSSREHVLVLDTSASMSRGDALRLALESVKRRARELPRRTTTVISAGSHVRTLLAPGEESPLLDQRATNLVADAAPSSIERAIRSVCSAALPADGAAIEVFGVSPIDPALLANLPKNVVVSRASVAENAAENAGITALGLSEPRSGAWSSVDLFVEVDGPAPARGAAGAVRDNTATLTLDGAPLAASESSSLPDGRWRAIVRDVPARGGRVEARLARSDALSADDTAALVLPVRPAIRVALSASVPDALRAVLAADPGVTLVAGDGAADVVVRRANEPATNAAPALVLVDESTQPAAFVLQQPAAIDPDSALRRSYEALGLDEIDSTELAARAERPIELDLVQGASRGISVWGSLFEPKFDFTATRSFPLFLARSVRWLAGDAARLGTTTVGEARFGTDAVWTDADSRHFDPAGGEAAFPRAGDVRDAAGLAHHVSLLDTQTTVLARDATPLPAAAVSAASGAFEPLPWIVLAALILLLVEWWLVRTERIP
jgi:hypothetical protein